MKRQVLAAATHLAAGKINLLQFQVRDACGDAQTGLALHAHRLQCGRVVRTAEQQIAADPDADRAARRDTAVLAGKIAAANVPRGRDHAPGYARRLISADVNAYEHDLGEIR